MGAVRWLVLVSLAACNYDPPSSTVTDGATTDDASVPDAQQPDSTPACADSDGDGVCDELDTCPGSDDNADVDHDGIADGCDTWPCGEEPEAPSAMVAAGNGTWGATLSNVDFGGGRLKVANKNTDVPLSFAFSIHDSSCPQACVDQIEVGLVAGDRQKCPFDQTVPKNQNVTGTKSTMIRAPNTPGVYTVRYGLGENFNCTANGHNTWWLGEPDASQTIAILCVP